MLQCSNYPKFSFSFLEFVCPQANTPRTKNREANADPPAAHFNIYASLETLNRREVWTAVDSKKHLHRREPIKVCHPILVSKILLAETTFEEQLDPEGAYLAKDVFKPDYKITTAPRVCRQAVTECEATRANFQPVLQQVLEFLEVTSLLQMPVHQRWLWAIISHYGGRLNFK